MSDYFNYNKGSIFKDQWQQLCTPFTSESHNLVSYLLRQLLAMWSHAAVDTTLKTVVFTDSFITLFMQLVFTVIITFVAVITGVLQDQYIV